MLHVVGKDLSCETIEAVGDTAIMEVKKARIQHMGA